ncbi:unnamed protein product [Urochloa humidicola]
MRRASAAAGPSPITSSTHLLSSAARSTPPPPSTCARTPTRHSRSKSHAFMLCSETLGTPTMGTPLATLSATEFHPQCVTKHPHRRVRQHARLVAPLHRDAALEALAHLRRVGFFREHRLPVVLPDHQEVRPPAVLEPLEQLVQLLPPHRRQAPERDVHHGARRLGVEPLHVLGAVVRLEHARLVVVVFARREHRADREHVVWRCRHGGERAHLKLLARVYEDGGLGSLPVEGVEQVAEREEHRVEVVGRVGGRLGEESGQVPDRQRRQARELHGQRRVAAAGEVVDGGGVAVEVVVVDGEHDGGLDPVERGRDAAHGSMSVYTTRDTGRPRAASASRSSPTLRGPAAWKEDM